MDNINELIERLGNEEDAVRKMAAFKLQTSIADPSFAEVFIIQGGLSELRRLVLIANGNTLAYSLTSFSKLLDVDKGWEYVTPELISRVAELIVTHPLVNILRGAMSFLVAIVSHPLTSSNRVSQNGPFGFEALRPAITAHPEFLEMLVTRLSSADHALCANSLQLINALMRDSITKDPENEWPRFIKRLQDLGVIKAVFILMQGSALQDLAHPLLEFQALTKILVRKWRDVKVDLERKDHRNALKGLHIASASPVRKNPEKWRRLGFETESPAWEFGETGFLGMMDFTDFVRKHEEGFQQLILEQDAKPREQRIPVARASLTVTSILCQQFQVDKSEIEDAKTSLILESRTNFEKAFRPLLLQWSRLHTAGLLAFFRLWKTMSATSEDFDKVADLMRVLMYEVVGQAPRTKEIQDVEDELAQFEYTRLRDLQMELLEQSYENTWGDHLRQVREELKHEATEFVKEQRIRCLLSGAWFTTSLVTPEDDSGVYRKEKERRPSVTWRYVRLSHNRRYLHYSDFSAQRDGDVRIEDLTEKIDLSTVSSVVSSVLSGSSARDRDSQSTVLTSETLTPHQQPKPSSAKITIHGHTNMNGVASNGQSSKPIKEVTLLTLFAHSRSLASEWLDGLLWILNQNPITAETFKLIETVTNYGLKIRLLNIRYTDEHSGTAPQLPSREGVDEEYYYSMVPW